MARGDLLKKLFQSQPMTGEARATALQIIMEEEAKKNFILAKSLRKALDTAADTMRPGTRSPAPTISLQALSADREKRSQLVEFFWPKKNRHEIVLSRENADLLSETIQEFRQSAQLKAHGLTPRSKLLFCGPPGCGKTICAEIFASELGLPVLLVRLDVLVSSYLGETASNLRRVFDYAAEQPCVLFFDEFDAVARTRNDETEHSELRRVVNALLQLIERQPITGFVIAATNHEAKLDPAIWRRFDEVVLFSPPDNIEIKALVRMKMRNFPKEFSIDFVSKQMEGFTHAEIERVCINSIRRAILSKAKVVNLANIESCLNIERHRRTVVNQLMVESPIIR